MGRRTKKKGRRKPSVPGKEWAERLEKNMRDSADLQEFLSALRAAGGFSQDICNFLYGYCAWGSLSTSRMAKWREHVLEQYAKAEKALLKIASDLEEVNNETYLTAPTWGQLIQDASVALRQELNHPPVVASKEGDHIVGMTPVNLTVDLPRILRIFADHLKQLRTATADIMFARRLGRNYELLELYLYLCCIKGIEPYHDRWIRENVQRTRPYKAVCGEVASLIGAAVNESIDPELVEKDIEKFREMNPWLCKMVEQNFLEYGRYRMRAQDEHKLLTPYYKWMENAQSEHGSGAQYQDH
jgi:hypothetical protein